MRLVLPLPDDWQVEAGAAGAYAAKVPGVGAPGELTLRVPSFVVADDNLIKWTERVLREDLGVGAETLRCVDGTTELGWPTRIILVQRGSGAAATGHLYGFYRFLDYGGQATFDAKPPAVLQARLDLLEGILRRGWPDFSTDQTYALAQLWM